MAKLNGLTKEDILKALGLEQSGDRFGAAAAAFGAGLLVGAAVALILAPKSGAEMREEIARKARETRDRITNQRETVV